MCVRYSFCLVLELLDTVYSRLPALSSPSPLPPSLPALCLVTVSYCGWFLVHVDAKGAFAGFLLVVNYIQLCVGLAIHRSM